MEHKGYSSPIRAVVLVLTALLLTGFLIIFVATPIGIFAPMGKAMAWVERTWGRILLKLAKVRVKASGMEHVRPGKTYIFIANHQSLFDIPIMMAYAPKQLRMIFKRELYYVPLLGWILWLLRFIAIDRGNREKAALSLIRAARKIHDGTNIVIYADGTRSIDGALLPFKKGAFILAINAQVDIVPVTISGTINIMHKYRSLFDVRFDQEVAIVFGEPVSTEGYSVDQKDELKNVVESEIARHFDEVRHLSEIDDPVLLRKIQAVKGTRQNRTVSTS